MLGRMGLGTDGTGAVSAAAVTRLLERAGEGDRRATQELLPLVYAELRAVAARKMRRERPDLTLQATALVHEAYLRLVSQSPPQKFDGRRHFFAVAAEAMRRILIEHARRRGRDKRGGKLQRQSLDTLEVTVNDPPADLLALDEALTELTVEHPEKAELVKLRYFAGLTMEQAAEAMGISPATAGRYWAYARAWLYARVSGAEAEE